VWIFLDKSTGEGYANLQIGNEAMRPVVTQALQAVSKKALTPPFWETEDFVAQTAARLLATDHDTDTSVSWAQGLQDTLREVLRGTNAEAAQAREEFEAGKLREEDKEE
jgi:hypothetical protein